MAGLLFIRDQFTNQKKRLFDLYQLNVVGKHMQPGTSVLSCASWCCPGPMSVRESVTELFFD